MTINNTSNNASALPLLLLLQLVLWRGVSC
jgi:hypothetical protein